MLLKLAFSGRHRRQSVWVLTHKYNTVCKDLRGQTKWVALFHCKDKDSFVDCLDENNIVPAEERTALLKQLSSKKYVKLVLNTDTPSAYTVF